MALSQQVDVSFGGQKMRFIVHNQDGKILRTGECAAQDLSLQAHKDEFALKGAADDLTQKIVDGKVVNKTTEEIEAEKPKPIPAGQQQANITNEQWEDVLWRLGDLEKG